MPIGEICNREVIVVQHDDTILKAAKLMRQHHVGHVVVIKNNGGLQIPIGIVTDRDLVVEIVATELNPGVITVGDIMATTLARVLENIGVFEAIQYMRDKGIRRLPVVGDDGGLVGIVTLDDLLALLAEELGAFSQLMAREEKNEASNRR